MSILYKAPLEHFDWGRAEFRVLLRGLVSPSGVDRREELREWLAERYESKSVTLFNSGRSALEAAAAHLRATHGARRRVSGVLMPSLVCDSVPRKIAAAGLRPVFFDMTPGMAPDLEDAMRRIDGETLAVLIPYVYGLVIDIDELVRVCRAQGIAIIEDCAPSALLPAPSGRMSGLAGDYTILSFQLGKTLVAGGGGALIRRNEAATDGAVMRPRPWTAEEERALVRSKRGFLLRYGYPGAGYYMSRLLGPIDLGLAYQTYNQVHSMAAVDSALVFCQIERWPELKAKREAILRRYAAAATPGRAYSLPQLDRPNQTGTYVQRLFVEFPADVVEWKSDGSSRSTLFEFLEKRGLQSQKTYCPAHELAEFQEWATGPLPETERLVRRLLAVPTQPRLRAATVEWIQGVLQEAAGRVAGGEHVLGANRGVRFA